MRVFMKVGQTLFLLVLLVVLATTLLFFSYQKEVGRHPNSERTAPVSFAVAEGEGAAAVARRLQEQDLISSSYVFRLYLWQRNLTSSLQAGVFQIPPNASLQEIVEVLQHGKFDMKLTFIEGWRREEMVKYLNSKVSFGEEFLEAAYGLEGYLFPDTYYVPTWFTAKQLVEMMRVNFEKKFQSLQDEARGVGEKRPALSPEELVTLASIVERETKFPEDRSLVAGILFKRYDNNWPLEADATLQYAMSSQRMEGGRWKMEKFDFWPQQITAEDLNLDSTYNTRKYRGLPPTPISNPGLAALRAALFPQESPYWFYLSDKEGKMHYARTIEEHSRNSARYLSE